MAAEEVPVLEEAWGFGVEGRLGLVRGVVRGGEARRRGGGVRDDGNGVKAAAVGSIGSGEMFHKQYLLAMCR